MSEDIKFLRELLRWYATHEFSENIEDEVKSIRSKLNDLLALQYTANTASNREGTGKQSPKS